MPQEIIDLDESGVIEQPLQVKLRGVVYKLPADIPAPLYLRISHGATEGMSDADATQVLYEELLATFQQYQPTLERLPLGIAEMVRVVQAVYGADDTDDAPADPTPAATAATTTGKTPRTSKSTARSRS